MDEGEFRGERAVVTKSRVYLISERNELVALDREKHCEVAALKVAVDKERAEIGARIKAKRKKRKDIGEENLAAYDAETEHLKQELEAKGRAFMQVKDSEILWRAPCAGGRGLILAGDTLFVGADNEVRAHRTTDGKQMWLAQGGRPRLRTGRSERPALRKHERGGPSIASGVA